MVEVAFVMQRRLQQPRDFEGRPGCSIYSRGKRHLGKAISRREPHWKHWSATAALSNMDTTVFIPLPHQTLSSQMDNYCHMVLSRTFERQLLKIDYSLRSCNESPLDEIAPVVTHSYLYRTNQLDNIRIQSDSQSRDLLQFHASNNLLLEVFHRGGESPSPLRPHNGLAVSCPTNGSQPQRPAWLQCFSLTVSRLFDVMGRRR